MIDVVWLSVKEGTPGRGYWDQTLLEDMFSQYHHSETINHQSGAIVVIPGAYQKDLVGDINKQLAKLKWCIVIITSDEENNFPIDKLKHKNMQVYANYYNPKYKSNIKWLPIGPARRVKTEKADKRYNWSFAGQVTHGAREAYALVMRRRDDGVLIETKGFAQGIEPKEYHQLLAETKVVPSPQGNISPDSFRTYEAIEQGAVPVPQDPDFWRTLFINPPFPIIEEYKQLNGYINDALLQYPKLNNEVGAWWLWQLRQIKNQIIDDIDKLAGIKIINDITVVIPVSPIKSHPNTKIIDETIKSIRHHLPEAEILVTMDGIREEQENYRDRYEKFKENFIRDCFQEYDNVFPIIFDDHLHQVGMAREIIDKIRTPLLLYVEQDTPLETNFDVDWDLIVSDLEFGKSNLVRFHFESRIPKEHSHMVHGMDARTTAPLMMTSQWSQRPHLSTVAFYRRILNDYFSKNARSFIEDNMHGIVYQAYVADGMLGWEQFKLHIYCPPGNIRRSYHTDGREGESKYDNSQVF